MEGIRERISGRSCATEKARARARSHTLELISSPAKRGPRKGKTVTHLRGCGIVCSRVKMNFYVIEKSMLRPA